ncbi:tRNA pseudouridine(55) synthase TruB [Acetobacteraceae bacterium ESL0709]|nr:tRNA pseudouridine(55) synthase TruB [Acetobacteraceae bacterium ESL0697]MDF7677493.1 tRNA pseudouridine(55) synthase TruB [Acetobacteraceae bacterium ESL0709]
MARKYGREINGWLILDKPLGPTSTDMVNKLLRLFDARKAGHGGTLDPLATGVLPVAFGRATATIPYIMDATKRYCFTLKFGESRTTDDGEGEPLAFSDYRPSDEEIRVSLPQFCGNVMQVPPIYSALRVGGKRAYDLARAGRSPEMPPRQVRIDSVELIERPDQDHAVFEVQSGKGVYMRSLARDIALACGTVGHITVLRRLQCGPFDLSHAYKLDEIVLDKRAETRDKSETLPVPLLEVATALADIPALAVTKAEGKALICGQTVEVSSWNGTSLRGFDVSAKAETLWRVVLEGHVLGLCRFDEGRLRAVRMLENHLFFGENDVDYT